MRIIVFLFVVLNSFSGLGQNLVFKNYTAVDGIPSNQVYDIYQDDNGYLWFATDRGICRYNGYSFESFSINDGLTCNTVFKFYPQQDGNVWCSTYNNKLFYFNPNNYKFIPYAFNLKLNGFTVNKVIDDLIVLKDGTISLSFTNYVGVVTINASGKLVSKKNADRQPDTGMHLVIEKIENNFFGSISEKSEIHFRGSTLISSHPINSVYHVKSIQNGAYSVLKSSDKVYLKKGDRLIKTLSSKYEVLNVGQFDDNSFWVGYNKGGVKVYNNKGELVKHLLEGKSITHFFRDHADGLWFSSLTSGVYYCDNLSLKQYELGSSNHIFKLAQDDKKQLWVSTYDKNLYYQTDTKFVKKNEVFRSLVYPLSYNSKELDYDWYARRSIIINDKYLSFTSRAPYDVTAEKNPSESVEIVLPKLLGYRANKVIKYNGIYYIGTNNGLYMYNADVDEVVKHKNAELSLRIEDLVEANNQLYIATVGGGVVSLRNDSIIKVPEFDKLRSDFVNQFYLEGDSALWVCTNKGLKLILVNDSSINILGYNILPKKNITDIEIISDTLWIGTGTGLYSIHKSALKEQKLNQDFFNLIKVEINDKTVDKDELLELNYKQNQLKVNYQAISFKHRSRLVYRYKIDGLEDEWHYTQNTMLLYPNISYGVFNLIIEVSQNGKEWLSKRIEIPFEIHPPFYLTNWFRLSCVLFGGFLFYLFFKFRILSYNRDIIRELLRLILKRLNRKTQTFIVRSQGKDIKINSKEVLFVKSQGNYLEIVTKTEKIIIRERISNFMKMVPDSIEYLQVHRSYIVRIDSVSAVGVGELYIGSAEISIGNTYKKVVSEFLS